MAPLAGMIRYNTDSKYFERSTNEGSSWAQLDLSGITTLVATTAFASGTVPTARLGSGTADNTKFLRGDQTWAAPSAPSAATPALDNLASVAINTSLLPATDNAIDLGSVAKSWRDLFVDRNGLVGGTLGITGITTHSANIAFTGAGGIRQTTSDGADNSYIEIAGGGAVGAANTRGAWYRCNGNEEGSFPGMHVFEMGNVTGSKFRVRASGGGIVFEIDGNTGLLSSVVTFSNTSGSAANVFVDSNGLFWRSTSSLKYKEDLKVISLKEARKILELNTYSFTNKNDKGKYIGLIAEEVYTRFPLIVGLDKDNNPDWLMYDRFPAYIIPLLKDFEQRLTKGGL